MNLALVYLWKEWRAQRALLTAYVLLMVACLCIGLSMAPTHYWLEEEFGTHALTWFVAAGVIGVVAFAAPGLVRGEFGIKGDQFVRRLPGALRSAYWGKLLFLGLCALLLPLTMLLIGEWFVEWYGGNWDRLFHWDWFGAVYVKWPWLVVACGAAFLLLPWIWAIGCWLPGGRMALGGALLFVLLVGLGVSAVLRQSPNLAEGIAWRGWLWLIAPLGFAVAYVSWTSGRRGGGPLRSARFGLAAAVVGFAPPGAWFAERAWRYHHPDAETFVDLRVTGITNDARFALVHGANHQNWLGMPFRVDLSNGHSEQLGGMYASFTPGLVRPYLLTMEGTQRYWQHWDYRAERDVFDLQTGELEPLAFDERSRSPVPSRTQAARLDDELRGVTPLRLPGNVPVWMRDGWLVTELEGGGLRRIVEVRTPASVQAAGHGVRIFGASGQRFVELATGSEFGRRAASVYWVRDRAIFVPEGPRRPAAWHRLDDGKPVVEAALVDCEVLGLLDDDRLLCARPVRAKRPSPPRLFALRPADGAIEEFAVLAPLPWGSVQCEAPMHQVSAVLPRDPIGRVWLRCSDGNRDTFALLDPVAKTVVELPKSVFAGDGRWRQRVLAWPSVDRIVMQDGASILALDLSAGLASAAATKLFPRSPR